MCDQQGHFIGTLNIWGVNCVFSFSNGYSLEIRPENESAEMFQLKCKELKGNFDDLGWIYGVSKWGKNVAFYPSKRQGPFSYIKGTLSLIIDIVLSDYSFKDAKEVNKEEKLHRFNAIDFCGESIDSVFSPKCIFDGRKKEINKIEWSSVEECARAFKTSIDEIPCTIIFTVFVDRKDVEPDETSLGMLRTILRLEFETPQEVSLIEKCWESVCCFLAFCTGHFNITDLHISLWDEEKPIGKYGAPGVIDCQINNAKVENIKYTGRPYNRLQISWLDDKVGCLFELLCSKDKKPRLGFLPQTNVDINVDSHKIRDLCTAFEVEYELREKEFTTHKPENLVKALKETIKVYKRDHPGELSEDIYNSAFNSVGFISLPAREKIWAIYSQFRDVIDAGFKQMVLFSNITFNFSEDKTRDDIKWLVKLRNSITHSSAFTEQDIPNAIYSRLRVAVYCSVFTRAGYSSAEIAAIVNAYFNGGYTA